jgi:putative nucleotidyltransferase with HDIG domain
MHPKFANFIKTFLSETDAEVVIQLFELCWKQFRILRASSTMKYHHEVENYMPYGLVNHIMRTVWVANELCREEQGKYNESVHKQNDVIIAAFLHDLGKILSYRQSHAQLGLKYLQVKEITDSIRDMVSHHHHNWDVHPCQNVWERIVAYADYLASRPEIEINALEEWYLKPEDEKDEF